MNTYLITHYYHSGFSVACRDILLLFDYWRGDGEDLPERFQLTEKTLSAFRQVYVFISHDHMDHLDPVVFSWKDHPGIQYIISSDMPVGTLGRRMAPGDTHAFSEDVTVSAFDSTDLGVSFLVQLFGLQIFHAGDLNFWHWREESTLTEIEEADNEFRKALMPLAGHPIDVAFFPVDPRQGTMFEAGANYFILSIMPRILIPMHYFHRAETAVEYARTASCRTTEVIALPGYGDQIELQSEENGFLNLSFLKKTADMIFSPGFSAENASNPGLDELLSENDPFLESDLPLSQLAEKASSTEEASGGNPPESDASENDSKD